MFELETTLLMLLHFCKHEHREDIHVFHIHLSPRSFYQVKSQIKLGWRGQGSVSRQCLSGKHPLLCFCTFPSMHIVETSMLTKSPCHKSSDYGSSHEEQGWMCQGSVSRQCLSWKQPYLCFCTFASMNIVKTSMFSTYTLAQGHSIKLNHR